MRMLRSKGLRRIGLALAVALPLIGLIAWFWAIPAAIVAAIRQRHEGYVRIGGWWIGGSSAGVTGLELHEGAAPTSPTWAAVERVTTDLSLAALLRGRFTPRRIVFDRPSIAYRIGADGQALTRIPMRQSGPSDMPELFVRDGTLAMRQEGRPEMVVQHLGATMTPDPGGPPFTVKADDPDWGHPGLEGRFTPDFSGYSFLLTAEPLPADPEKARRVPFVEEKIWTYIVPHGPIGVVLACSYQPPGPGGGSGRSMVVTTVNFERTTVDLPTLGLHGEEAVGPLTVQDKVVELKDVRGRMCGGRVAFSGPIDFKDKRTHYDLALQLDGVDLTALPESWQLHRLGVRGRFTGKAGLKMALPPEGIDMTGSTGEGVIDGAEIRGIPLERLELTLRGEGLRPRDEDSSPSRDRRGAGAAPGGPLADARGADGGKAGKEGPFLPQWIRGEFRVEHVELKNALAHVEAPKQPGGSRDVPVTGRVALEATVRFPLGSLEDWKAYAARGTADVAGASIGGLDLGRLKGRLDLADGRLEVADLCGRLVDRPEGGGRPSATEPPPAQGPLPRGGFRGRVRAELVGDRSLQVDLEGVELPMAALAAAASTLATSGPSSSPSATSAPTPPPPPSALPPSRVGPISGRLTIRGSGRSRGADPSDPRSWTASGRAEMPEVAYRTTVVKDVSTDLVVDGGRLVLPDLAGRLGDAALKGRLGLDLAGPWSYDGELDTGDLSCRELLGLVPNVSGWLRSHVEGTIAGRGEARGTLRPWRVASSGQAKVAGLKVDRVAIGDVPLRWTTQGETINVTAEEHRRYGGRVSAEVHVPVAGDRPIEGAVTLAKVDAAELTSGARGSWKLTGHADGQARFRYTPGARRPADRGPPLEAEAHLTADDLTVGGVPARSLKMTLTVHEGDPRFDLAAEGLGGTIHLTGDGHLATDPKDDELRAGVEAIGLQLYELWGALGTSGPLAGLRGRTSIKGRVQARGGLDVDHARGQGSVELDEPIWGYDYRLGSKLLAEVSKAPEGWRVGPLGGELFGGRVLGDGIWMYRGEGGRPRYGVDARVEQLLLPRALSFLPEADRRFAGTGTLRVGGRKDGAVGGTGEFRVERGFVNGLELTELRVPGDWTFSPGPPRRGSLSIRKVDGRLAGGRVGGEAHFILGDRRDFRARLIVDDVDLRVISREEMGSRPVPGRLSGYVNVYGTDPAQPVTYRGELDFDLDQASLVDIPLLDELDRSLGSTQGGVFDDGDLHGTISERKVHIDRLTLVGPLAQVHAAGTVDFDGRLNLEVVVNNNRGIYQSGQAMMARSPNVADEVARRASQIDQVRDFISSRLMKFRITGTIRDPIANVDRSINPRAAIGFFLKAMRLSAQSR